MSYSISTIFQQSLASLSQSKKNVFTWAAFQPSPQGKCVLNYSMTGKTLPAFDVICHHVGCIPIRNLTHPFSRGNVTVQNSLKEPTHPPMQGKRIHTDCISTRTIPPSLGKCMLIQGKFVHTLTPHHPHPLSLPKGTGRSYRLHSNQSS